MRTYLVIAAIVLSATQAHAVTRGLTLASHQPGDEAAVSEPPKISPPELPRAAPATATEPARAPSPVQSIVQPQAADSKRAASREPALAPVPNVPAASQPIVSQPIANGPAADSVLAKPVIPAPAKRVTTEARIRRELRRYGLW